MHGPENDRTLGMRNWLGYNAARRMGRYASRTQYFELFLNTVCRSSAPRCLGVCCGVVGCTQSCVLCKHAHVCCLGCMFVRAGTRLHANTPKRLLKLPPPPPLPACCTQNPPAPMSGASSYLGVYMLQEKVSRSKQRVDVAKFSADTDMSGARRRRGSAASGSSRPWLVKGS